MDLEKLKKKLIEVNTPATKNTSKKTVSSGSTSSSGSMRDKVASKSKDTYRTRTEPARRQALSSSSDRVSGATDNLDALRERLKQQLMERTQPVVHDVPRVGPSQTPADSIRRLSRYSGNVDRQAELEAGASLISDEDYDALRRGLQRLRETEMPAAEEVDALQQIKDNHAYSGSVQQAQDRRDTLGLMQQYYDSLSKFPRRTYEDIPVFGEEMTPDEVDATLARFDSDIAAAEREFGADHAYTKALRNARDEYAANPSQYRDLNLEQSWEVGANVPGFRNVRDRLTNAIKTADAEIWTREQAEHWDEVTREAVNAGWEFGDEDFEQWRDEIKITYANNAQAVPASTLTDMRLHYTKEEAAVYAYLEEQGRQDDLTAYVNYLQPIVAERRNAQIAEDIAEESPAMRTATAIVANPYTVVNGLSIMLQDMSKRISGSDRPVDYQTFNNWGTATDTAMGTVAQELAEYGTLNDLVSRIAGRDVQIPGVGDITWGDVYTTAVSRINSIVSSAVFGKNLALPAMVTQVGGQAYVAGRESGLNEDQAMLRFLSEGVPEGITEFIQLDSLFGAWAKTSTHMGIKGFLAIGLREAAEEGVQEMLNPIMSNAADRFFLGEDSEYNRRVEALVAEGYDRDTAENIAQDEAWGEVLKSGLLALVGGGGSYIAGAPAASYLNTSLIGADIRKQGNQQALASLMSTAAGKDVKAPRTAYGTGRMYNDLTQNTAQRLNDEAVREYYKKMQNAGTVDQQNEKNSNNDVNKKTLRALNRLNNGKGLYFWQERRVYGDESARATLGAIQENRLDVDNTKLKASELAYALPAIKMQPKKGTVAGAHAQADERLDEMNVDTKAKTTTVNGEEVKVTKVANVAQNDTEATVTVKKADGSTADVKISEVTFGKDSRPEAMAYAQDLDTPELANAFIFTTKDSRNLDEIANAMHHAYDMAKSGFNFASIQKTTLTKGLSEHQLQRAYELGVADKAKAVDTQQAAADARQANNASKAWQSGRINMGTVVYETLSSEQKRNLDLIDIVAGLFGMNVEVFESKANAKGRFTEENGSYNKATNTIRLDINAGRYYTGDSMAQTAMLRTMSHELTHTMQRNSPKQYEAYKAAVLDVLERQGANIEELVDAKLAADSSLKDRDEAMDEVVADASETMLRDSDAVERLRELHPAEAQSFARRVLNLIKRIKDAIREAFGNGKLTKEAQYAIKELDKLAEMWSDMAVEVADVSGREASDAQTDIENASGVEQEADVRYQKRGYTSERMSQNEISDIVSIGRKSVNEFNAEDIRKTRKLAQRYFSEMGVKSPFFRAWFGDWRAYDNTPINIATKPGKERGTVTNIDTGWSIQVSRKVFTETISHMQEANVKARPYLDYINDIVENAILLDSYGLDDAKSANSLLMHSLYAIADIGKGPEMLKLYVEEMNDVNKEDTGKRSYQLQNIENQQLSVTGSGKSLAVSFSTADVNTISDLVRAVKKTGDLKSAKPVSPLMLNADGTPKVMYHGSPANFTVFDIKKAKSSGLYGKGFYFTDSTSHGSTYGKLYEVYLSIQNPLTPGGNTVTRAQVRKFLEAVAENEDDYSIENYGTYDIDEILKNVYRKDAFAVIQDVSATAIGDLVEAVKLFNEVNGTKFDGIVVETETVAFEPTQIKSATDNIGTFDPDNPDIRYQARSPEALSDREILANALEDVAATPEEKLRLAAYKEGLTALNEKQAELDKNREIVTRLTNELRGNQKSRYDIFKTLREASGLSRGEMTHISRLENTIKAYEGTTRHAPLDKQRYEEAIARVKEYAQKANLTDAEFAQWRDAHKDVRANDEARYLSAADFKELQKARNRMKTLAGQVSEYDQALINLERMKPIQDIVQREGDKVRERMQERIADVRQTYENAALRKSIARRVKKLNDTLINPTDTRHVPDEFRFAVLNLMKAFTNDTSIFDKETLSRLATEYAAIEKSNSDAAGLYDDSMKEIIDDLKDKIGGRRLAKLTEAELKDVRNVVEHFQHIVSDSNKVFFNGRRENIDSLAMEEDHNLSGKQHYETRLNTGKLAKWLNEGQITAPYFFRRLGGVMGKLGNALIEAESSYGVEVNQAKARVQEIMQKHNHKSWANKRNDTLTFTTEEGATITLSREEALGLYATDKRERLNVRQEAHHLSESGITFKRDRSKLKWLGKDRRRPVMANAAKISRNDMQKINGWLTAEQKAYADEMVEYLSTDMARLGNETSRQLHGWSKFDEGYYYPYKTNSDFFNTKLDNVEAALMKNMRHTKRTVRHANNPLVITDFTTTVAEHINNMLLYHNFAVPQDTFMRVYDHHLDKSRTIKSVMKSAYGLGVDRYITQLMKDLYGGITRDPGQDFVAGMQARYKKNAVMMSMSVVFQQPSSLIRAFAQIDPKYFTHIPRFGGWSEAMQYAGTAVIKSIGGFDTSTGKNIVDWMTQEHVAEGVMDGIDKLGGFLPGKADQATWGAIWQAVKQEQAAKTGLSIRSEELKQLAGKRFDEVIRLTQVYDSTLSRSQNMRSSSGLMKMFTAFMGEPTVTYNMIYDSLFTQNRGLKHTSATFAAVLGSILLNSALKSLVTAARDDDEDEAYWEKWLNHNTSELVNSLNPLTYIPIARDVWSVMQGFTVERSDMEIANAAREFVELLAKEDKTGWDITKSAVTFGSMMTGIPAKNIWRDVEAVKNIANGWYNEYREGWATNAALSGALDQIPFYSEFAPTPVERIYTAALEGDSTNAERYREYMKVYKGKDDKQINSSLRSEIKSNYENGEIDDETAIRLLTDYTGMEADDAYMKVEEWEYEYSGNGDWKKTAKVTDAIDSGDDKALAAAVEELVEYGGYDSPKDAAQTIASGITSTYKPLYIAASPAERKQMKAMLLDAYETVYETAGLEFYRDSRSKSIDKWLE